MGSSVIRKRTAPQPQPPSRVLLGMATANAYLVFMTQYITVAADDRAEAKNGIIKLHGPEGFEGMRRAGRLAAEILDALAPRVVPGVTTQEIDDLVYSMMIDGG